jgi:hypothetical protein
VGVLHLLSGRDIVLEVTTCMLPCLQTLVEELGHLTGILIGNGIVVGYVGSRSSGQGVLSRGHVCGCVCVCVQREKWSFAMGESAKCPEEGLVTNNREEAAMLRPV